MHPARLTEHASSAMPHLQTGGAKTVLEATPCVVDAAKFFISTFPSTRLNGGMATTMNQIGCATLVLLSIWATMGNLAQHFPHLHGFRHLRSRSPEVILCICHHRAGKRRFPIV